MYDAINDPLDRCDHYSQLKMVLFGVVLKSGTDYTCEYSDHYRPWVGLPSGSIRKQINFFNLIFSRRIGREQVQQWLFQVFTFGSAHDIRVQTSPSRPDHHLSAKNKSTFQDPVGNIWRQWKSGLLTHQDMAK